MVAKFEKTAGFEISGRIVGHGHPCFIIAEAGVNHNGDMGMARQLIDAAVRSGADAVKFQTFKAERVITAGAPKAEYQKATTDANESQMEMIRRFELSPENHRELMSYCEERGIIFMSSFFDEESADLLEGLDMAVFKVPSGEITNLPLLAHTAAALRVIREAGNPDLVLLHCVSNYPADPADVNLSAMGTMSAAFGVPVGYSDHTLGVEVSLAAVALGACMIEKHLTLDRGLPGPDHRASLEPEEFTVMVRGIRVVESTIGHGRKEPAASEASTASVGRKSLVASRNIPAGTELTLDLIAIKRPGTGLPPAMREHLIGRRAQVDISADSLITLEMLG